MNTPRTDRNIKTTDWATGEPVVSADFVRQLETELQTMTALAERLAEAMKNSCNFPGCKNWHPESDNAIAAYESHKKQKP